MRKTTILGLTILLLGAMAAAGGKLEYPTPPCNIILIGWDGAQRNHMKECLGRDELPNLKRLINEGTIVAVDVLRTTDTKSGWAQILTGYEPEVTGVFSNGRFQPIPKGLTVFERLEEHFGSDRFVTVAVIGKKEHVDAEGPEKTPVSKEEAEPRGARQRSPVEGARLVEEGGITYRMVPGKPFYTCRDSLDVFLNGLREDAVVGQKALELLEKYKDRPFFFFVHFAEVDHKGHQFGENSKEYNDALISADTWTGRIMDKLQELGLYNQTRIYVTADHGFDEDRTSHSDAPYVFLATNDPKVRRHGDRVDIAPTILARFRLDLDSFQPPLDGHPLSKPWRRPKW